MFRSDTVFKIKSEPDSENMAGFRSGFSKRTIPDLCFFFFSKVESIMVFPEGQIRIRNNAYKAIDMYFEAKRK